uniref:Uncharacterized protein n=1 Tax=Chromera velia CCMP2878 TaxID=1169474 RepID=A0A0G4GCA6_9ALVE|eukprot:Cvel_21274.t1-p1 / transcript=Cvel_21274.t1 / gene=Cvel_21274 / organism=Chromera_velia_CCMP2878 / gene_product=hypothetical protein / transcript_product=hypothetical protein / location=Cvel_scaffold1980:15910-20207(+) / protein_length=1008 / sequence_SO=supercontig / SO=protein_coding / is_pseudo=false
MCLSSALLTTRGRAVSQEASGLHCTLVLTKELKEIVEGGTCPEASHLFPTPEDDVFWMLGQGQETAVVFGSEHSENILLFQPDDSKIQKAVEEETQKEGEHGHSSSSSAYLDEPLGGKWEFRSLEGEILASLSRSDVTLDFLLPPENALWNLCGQSVHLQLPCIVGSQPIHVENGGQGSPCSLFGECDEGLECVELSMFQKECVKAEEIPENMREKIVRGPQPAAPFTNCFFAPEDRKCAVEGFSCYQNTQWDDYAQCRPTGDCPRSPSRSAVKHVEMTKGRPTSAGQLTSLDLHRRMQEVEADPQSFTPMHSRGSTIQSVVRKLQRLDSFQGFRESRRRLSFEEGRERRRRLKECLQEKQKETERNTLHEVAAAPDNMRRIPLASSDVTPAMRVGVSGGLEVECQGSWFDFTEIQARHTDTPLEVNPLGEEVDFSFEEEEEDSDEIDIGWSYGWVCDDPLGRTPDISPSIEGVDEPAGQTGGVRSLRAARAEIEEAGLNPDIALGSFSSLQTSQQQGGSLLPSMPTPSPPPAEKKIWSGSFKCHPKVPSWSGAPGLTLGINIKCAPSLSLGPTLNLGVMVQLGPKISTAPGIHLGFTLYMVPYLRLSVTYSNAVRIYGATIVRLAPTSSTGVTLVFAPTVTAMPTQSSGISTTIAPVVFLPDIFEDWVLRRTPLPIGKVGRWTRKIAQKVDDQVRVGKKEGIVDVKAVVDFVYEDLTPVREIEDTLEQDLELPSLPPAVEKVGIKRKQKLGDYYSISTSVSVRCARYDYNYDRPNDRHVKVLYFEPRDGRRGGLSEECILPYPSDVIRDIPHLPPQAIYGIRALEDLESLIPPEVRIAATFLLRTVQVVGEGHVPNFGNMLVDYAGEYLPEGVSAKLEEMGFVGTQQDVTYTFDPEPDPRRFDRRLLEAVTANGTNAQTKSSTFSPVTFSKALSIAKDLTPSHRLGQLPSLFPKWSKTWQRAEAMAKEIADKAFHLFQEGGVPGLPSETVPLEDLGFKGLFRGLGRK